MTQIPARDSLAQRLGSLPAEKLAILQKRLEQQPRASLPPMPALPDEDVYPLSYHQRRLWFVEQYQPGTPLYNVSRAIGMRGPLNRHALESALHKLVGRHEALRTVFHVVDGEPVQRVQASFEFELPVVHLKSTLDEQLTAEGRRVFDLSADLMMRAVLYQLADDHHVLQVTIHHLACDGWSLQLLFDELAELYSAQCSGRAAELPPIRHRYVDFARWQRGPRQTKLFAQRLQWWQEQLAGAPAVLELPADHPRPEIESDSGAIAPFEVPTNVLGQLDRLAREENATLYMTLLAGFVILLHRYTGMTDFLVGSATSGRHRAETHRIVGFFVNTVALRADLSGEPTARVVLRRLRQTVIDAVQHSDVPFERVVDSLDLHRELNRQPLVQVLFNTPPQYSLKLCDLEVSPIDVNLHISRFDLEMTFSDGDNRKTGITWNTDLFDADTIERMLGHYCALLDAIAENPDRSVHSLPLMTVGERQRLLVEWNDTATCYPRDRCIHEIFQRTAERTPESVAVVCEDQYLTYRELNRRANRLAHHLRSLGVSAETLVGLCLDRSPELAVGILGILKAGGAYVPCDADQPPERLGDMIAGAQIRFVVTKQRFLRQLPATDCQVVCLDADVTGRPDVPESNPSMDGGADNLAYVMFTSGSTGRPKAVAIRHFSVTRLVFGNDYTSFGPDRVFLQLAAASFDASTFEIWGALLHGATLVIAPSRLPDFRQLEKIIKRNRVTTVLFTTPLFNQVVGEYPQALHGVEEILVGGEALSVQHICKAQAALGITTQLVNGYGPTESTTFATCYRIPSNIAPELESIPIGRPIGNTQAYILDAQRQPVPIGVPGELYVGGDGLARGYLNRPEMTAERFVRSPFSNDSKSRLYRTGDLCRWRADGNLEFLGRLDNQIKLRGYRIEPGEIESAIEQYAGIAHSVVTLREDDPGNKQLVAYYTCATDAKVSCLDLRRHLRNKLPDYMVPSAYVILDTLPLTSHGKINRRALPAPDESRGLLEGDFVAPRSAVEEQLASIWGELLGVEQVGVHDDFFALGGHSLLATRVISRLRNSLRIDLPVRSIFQAPTIAVLSQLIGDNQTAEQKIPRIKSRERMPLSFGQQRLWFIEQLEGELTAYNMPFAWRLRGPLDTEALRRALEAIVQRHEPLRTTFEVHDGQPFQVVRTVEWFDLPLTDLGTLTPERKEQEVARRLAVEARQPFQLTRDLMLRASLLRLDRQEHLLLVTMHHIASDGWSWRLFTQELGTLYNANCRDADCRQTLPELPLRYVDYAAWQRNELAGVRLDELVDYWRGKLDGLSPLELPTDRPRPARQSYRGARHDFTLDSQLVQQLRSLSQSEGVTLQMTLLAAFQTLLSRYSGQDDVAVGTPTAGRNHSELESLIGFFVNTLVLRTDLSGEPTFRELLARVRQVSLEAYEHEDLPFEKLVEELQPQRSFGHNPLIQVLFQLLDFSYEDLTLQELNVTRLPPSGGRVRFDLEMHLLSQRDSILGQINYSIDLFNADTIQRLTGHFMRLLEEVARDCDRPVDELPMISDQERQRLLVQWNKPAAA